MQPKANKNLVIVFRICIFAAFFTGLMYFVKFIGRGSGGSRAEFFAAVSGFFYAYLAFTMVSLVLSVICFKTTSKASSVARTISLAVVSLVLLLNISFIRLVGDALQAQASGDLEQMIEANLTAERVMNGIASMEKVLLSFAGVFVLLVLSVTSVVALVKTLKGNAA